MEIEEKGIEDIRCEYICPRCHSRFDTKEECIQHMDSCEIKMIWKINLSEEIDFRKGEVIWHVNIFHQPERSPFCFNEILEDGGCVDDETDTGDIDYYMNVEHEEEIPEAIEKMKIYVMGKKKAEMDALSKLSQENNYSK